MIPIHKRGYRHRPAERRLSGPGWRVYWRNMRIFRREAGKAAADALIYGSGFLKIDDVLSGRVSHVLPQNVMLFLRPDGNVTHATIKE